MSSSNQTADAITCLKNFLQQQEANKRSLLDFLSQRNVGEKMVEVWLDQVHRPSTSNLYALTAFLHVHGYAVLEYERIHESLREIALLVGLNVITVKQLAISVNMMSTDDLWRILRGDRATSKKRLQKRTF